MAYKPQVVNLDGMYHKWVRLLTHMQNSTKPVYRCTLESEAEAKFVYQNMHNACARDPWFHLIILRRHNEVYVVKSDNAQEMVIKEYR